MIDQRKLQSWLFGTGIFIGIILIVIAILASIKIIPYATYTDPKSGIQVQFPAYWQVIDRPEGGAIVAFLTPKDSALDVFIENVNISMKTLPDSSMTLEKFSKEAIKQLTGTFEGFISLLESQYTRVADHPAYKIVYTGDVAPENVEEITAKYGKPDLSNPMKYMIVWVLNNNHAYIITYVAPKNDFDKYLKEVDKIINSFHFI